MYLIYIDETLNNRDNDDDDHDDDDDDDTSFDKNLCLQ